MPKLEIEYDPEIASLAVFLGYSPEAFYGDLGSLKAVVENICRRKGCSEETAKQVVMKELALDLERFFRKRWGSRK